MFVAIRAFNGVVVKTGHHTLKLRLKPEFSHQYFIFNPSQELSIKSCSHHNNKTHFCCCVFGRLTLTTLLKKRQ